MFAYASIMYLSTSGFPKSRYTLENNLNKLKANINKLKYEAEHATVVQEADHDDENVPDEELWSPRRFRCR